MTNNATKVEVTYSGKMDGLTFEKFDDLVVRWGRKKWGDKYATALWQDELLKGALRVSLMVIESA